TACRFWRTSSITRMRDLVWVGVVEGEVVTKFFPEPQPAGRKALESVAEFLAGALNRIPALAGPGWPHSPATGASGPVQPSPASVEQIVRSHPSPAIGTVPARRSAV